MLTVTTCAYASETYGFRQSASGSTSVGLSATASNPALAVDVADGWVETAVVPGPFGLAELSLAGICIARSGKASGSVVGVEAMVGRAWHTIYGLGRMAWRLGSDADVGLCAIAGTSAGLGVSRVWFGSINVGARWNVDSVWSVGATLSNILSAGASPPPPRRLTIGVGRRISTTTTTSVDAAVDPTAGLGVTAAVRLHVHPRLVCRVALQHRPSILTLGVRTGVAASTDILFDVEFVRDLGVRTRLAAAWLL
jgi:hypothetical protein